MLRSVPALAILLVANVAHADDCSGCNMPIPDVAGKSLDNNDWRSYVGPLGSSFDVKLQSSQQGICQPDCSVERVCSFDLEYRVETGDFGIGSVVTTKSGRLEGGGALWQSYRDQVPTPTPGYDVVEDLPPTSLSCGSYQELSFKLWFNQPVDASGDGTPNRIEFGPIRFACSACEEPLVE